VSVTIPSGTSLTLLSSFENMSLPAQLLLCMTLDEQLELGWSECRSSHLTYLQKDWPAKSHTVLTESYPKEFPFWAFCHGLMLLSSSWSSI